MYRILLAAVLWGGTAGWLVSSPSPQALELQHKLLTVVHFGCLLYILHFLGVVRPDKIARAKLAGIVACVAVISTICGALLRLNV